MQPLSLHQRRWVEVEFQHKIEPPQGTFDEFRKALIGKWGDRMIPKHVDRCYGTLNAKDALPWSREERIQRLWEAIRALA